MPRWPLHEVPLERRGALLVLTAVAIAGGLAADGPGFRRLDRPLQDFAVAARARTRWDHAAVIAVDDRLPPDLLRVQMLPLFARAAQAAVRAGARGLFLDGRVLAFPDPDTRFATCVREGATIDRAEPGLEHPLALAAETAARFGMLAPLHGSSTSSCSELAAAPRRPIEPLVGPDGRALFLGCSDVARSHEQPEDGVVRWQPLHPRAAAVALLAPAGERTRWVPAAEPGDESCELGDDGKPIPCRRLRPSEPTARFGDPDRPVLALSALADCDEARAIAAAASLKDRYVILSPLAFAEREDLHPSPITVGRWLGAHPFVPGAQLLVDGVETLLAADGPRRAPPIGRVLLLVLAALLGVLAGARLRASAAVLVPPLLATLAFALDFASPARVTLWPVSATFAAAALGVAGAIGLHLVYGTRQARIAARYLPAQVRSLLSGAGGPSLWRGRRVFAACLFSDLKGYTTLTGALRDPERLVAVLNEYLTATTSALQREHGAWLENYVGDLVAFYWPAIAASEADCVRASLNAALALARLQRAYFAKLPERLREWLPEDKVEQLAGKLGAGIGVAAGEVVMGNLGPPDGVQKFSLLGDPLNLASRLESLTRSFDADLFVPGDVAEAARGLGLGVRRIARLKVKGRLEPCDVFAVGEKDDPRFHPEAVAAWETWATRVLRGEPAGDPPARFPRDAETLLGWSRRGLVDAATRTILLDEK